MSTSVRKHDGSGVARSSNELPTGSVRRLGSATGLAALALLDLLALDDITTAGAWLPEIGFIVASVPALVTLAYFTFRRARDRPSLSEADPPALLSPPTRT
jgi:hypothetical protein